MCILDHKQSTFFCLGSFLKKLANDQLFFHNYQTYVHATFYHGSGLTRYWMFNRSIYYVLYFYTRLHQSSGLTRNYMFNGSIYYVLFTDTAFFLGMTVLCTRIALYLIVFIPQQVSNHCFFVTFWLARFRWALLILRL